MFFLFVFAFLIIYFYHNKISDVDKNVLNATLNKYINIENHETPCFVCLFLGCCSVRLYTSDSIRTL